MDSRISKKYSYASAPSFSAENFSLTLIPCEYDFEEGYGSLSEDSVDSSEIFDSSDDEFTIKINEIHKVNEQSI